MISRSSKLHIIMTTLFLAGALLTSGCGVVFFGAASGGGGYETHQHNQMQRLEEEYAAGEIGLEEYEARKKQIQEASLLQR